MTVCTQFPKKRNKKKLDHSFYVYEQCVEEEGEKK